MEQQKPYIASIDNQKDKLVVTIVAVSQDIATEYARNYFGDYRTDYRNTNIVEYVCSDFSNEHINSYSFSVKRR